MSLHRRSRENGRPVRDFAAQARIWRALQALIVVQLALSGLAGFPGAAAAEVRKADVVYGTSVEARGLSVMECPSIDAERAVLMNADGTVYFERNAGDAAQIASITKVMTAIVALDNAEADARVVVGAEAAEVGESSANLQEGDVMNLDAALKALLVPSGNDAAVAIAEAVGSQIAARDPSRNQDAQGAFVDAMNAKAAEIGCTDTLYENPHGLDDGLYEGGLHSTALDQAKVAQCAMGYQKIRDIVGGGDTSITVERAGARETVDLETTDLLLDMYDSAIGVKTGVTDLAGPSFMGAANKDGLELYAVVLDSSDERERFEDAETLFEWAYEHIVDLPLAQTEEYTTMRSNGTSAEVPVVAAVSHGDWIDRTVKATLADPDAKASVFDLDGNVSQSFQLADVHGTVNAGDRIGTVTYHQRNEVIAECDLVACERVEAPNPIDAVAIWWQRFIGGFGGTPQQAESQVYNVMPIIDDNTSAAA